MTNITLEGRLDHVYTCSFLEQGAILLVPQTLYLTRISIHLWDKVADAIVYGVVPQNYEGLQVSFAHNEHQLRNGVRFYYQTLYVDKKLSFSIAAVSHGPLPTWRDVENEGVKLEK